jgi:gliding motility-associated-like protein
MRYLCLLLLILSTQVLHAQNEANIWYFGHFLGLDFNNGTPVPLNDGQLNTIEGVATISDANGNLLFYTDGITVWNRLHQVMPNGTGLFGNASSSQSAVIVPKIGDTTRYYVFTVDQIGGPNGLHYSVVNMTMAGGNGDVETKNVPLISNVTEKVTAVKHCNNRDIWVLAHKTVSNTYYAFLVDPSGVNTNPVISNTGSVLWGVIPPSPYDSTTLGYMKASPDGKKIAAAHWTVNLDVSDFNNATGVVSNTYSLFQPTDPHYLVYGVEFSPDSRLVYSTVFYTDPVNAQKHNALFQYDATLGSAASVTASKQVISLNSDPIQTYAALQVATNGKLYMAKNTYKHIAAIDNPNVYGPGCNFVSNAVAWTLPSQSCSFGLPTFIQSYFYPPDSFSYVVNCPGNSVNFNYNPSGGVISVQWNFGDPASGANNISTQNNPVHIFSAPGNYNVQLVKFTACGPDTLRKTVAADVLNINLGPDTLVCGGTSILLNSSAAGSTNNYLWQDGSTNPTFLATTTGLFWVKVTNTLGCNLTDSINVNFKPIPVFNLGVDTSICQGDQLTLNAGGANADSYLWNTNANSSSIPASAAGLYWCEANKGGCKFRDSISIATTAAPVVNLGNDVTVCEGITVPLDATYLNSTYLWQDGSTSPTYVATNQGIYFVQVNYNGCKRSDTIKVNHILKPRITLGPDQYICPGSNIILAPVVDPTWQLLWQDGSTNPTYVVTQEGIYSLTASNNCGSAFDDINILKGVCKLYVPSAFTPNGDGKNDLFRVIGVESIGKFDLKVFNRWGEVVFATTEKTKGWDGKIKGRPLPETTMLVYTLSYTDALTNESHFLKGNVLIIR